MSDTPLSTLPFIDLYMRLDQEDIPLYRSGEMGRSRLNQIVPDSFRPAINRFIDFLKTTLQSDDESVEFEGIRYRISRQHMSDDSLWVCARQIGSKAPDLEKLGFAPHIINHMRGLGHRDGLILIAGATGHGKTTTAAALLGDFLRSYGGTAIMIENPTEFPLRGHHGENGHCFQMEAKTDEEWAVCLKRAIQWSPRYIYVSEARTPEVVGQMLRAATTGHMVITTAQAGTPEEALIGLQSLAERAIGVSTNDVFAAAMTALVFQEMKETGPFIKYLFTEENASGDPIRSLIREGKTGMISTYIDRIAARLSNNPLSSTLPPLAPNSLPPLKK